jgi:GT2 family glycosyltransferase
VSSYEEDVVAVGGPLTAGAGRGVVLDYLTRHNPLAPQEVELWLSPNIFYRLFLYLRRQWTPVRPCGRRQVISLPTANFSARHEALLQLGGFDERIVFGAEDDDLCRRLAVAFPAKRVMFEPGAQVIHHFEPSLHKLVRRSHSYGRASALMFYKWPDIGPTFFPFPSVVLLALALSLAFPPFAIIAVLLPLALYPLGLRTALRRRSPRLLADAYLQLLEEASDNVGFLDGLWRYRNKFR